MWGGGRVMRVWYVGRWEGDESVGMWGGGRVMRVWVCGKVGG